MRVTGAEIKACKPLSFRSLQGLLGMSAPTLRAPWEPCFLF